MNCYRRRTPENNMKRALDVRYDGSHSTPYTMGWVSADAVAVGRTGKRKTNNEIINESCVRYAATVFDACGDDFRNFSPCGFDSCAGYVYDYFLLIISYKKIMYQHYRPIGWGGLRCTAETTLCRRNVVQCKIIISFAHNTTLIGSRGKRGRRKTSNKIIRPCGMYVILYLRLFMIRLKLARHNIPSWYHSRCRPKGGGDGRDRGGCFPRVENILQ